MDDNLLHLIKNIRGDELLIGNNIGKIKGWVSRADVCGVVIGIRSDRVLPGKDSIPR